MSSVVAQALAVKEKVQMVELERDVIVLLNDALSLRSDYIDAARSYYVKLTTPLNSSPYYADFANYRDTFQSVSEELKTAKPTPTFLQEQLDNLSVMLVEVKENLNVVKQLIEIDQSLRSAKEYHSEEKFLECGKTLSTCNSLLKQPACTDEVIDIITAMKQDWVLICENVMYFLTNKWREFISFKDIPRTSGSNRRIVQVKVSLKDDGEFVQAIEAMKYVDLQKFKFKSLGSILLESIFKPLVEHECVVRKEEKRREKIAILEVIIEPNSSCPIYTVVLHNLRLVFEFLNNYINHEIPENGKVLKLVGDYITNKFCKLVFRMSSFNNKDIAIFTDDVHATEEFKKFLSDIGFIPFDPSSQDKSIPELFGYLTHCKILEEARNIMHKKIFDTIEVKQIYSPKYQYYLDLFNKKGPKTEELLRRWEKFPTQLIISKSTHELMDLVCKLLEDATHKSKFEAVTQFYTVRNILEMYSLLLPVECQETAKNSAFLSAIIFNNCSHLCEWIISHSHKYHEYFPRLSNDAVITFAPEAIKIRTAGGDMFHEYVEDQIVQLLGHIDAKEFKIEEFFEQEKAVKQCLNTFEVLKSTWINVLAYHIYLKTMGVVITSVIKGLLKKIMAMEKISPKLALCIRVMLQDMVKRLQMHFTEEELSSVKYMNKLFSVKMILEGSAPVIIYKWKHGEGELAESLTINELHKLIKAVLADEEFRFVMSQIK